MRDSHKAPCICHPLHLQIRFSVFRRMLGTDLEAGPPIGSTKGCRRERERPLCAKRLLQNFGIRNGDYWTRFSIPRTSSWELPARHVPALFFKSISSCTHSGVAFHGMPLPENKATSGIKCSTRIPWGAPLTCSSSPDVDPPATGGWREHPAPQPEIAFAAV